MATDINSVVLVGRLTREATLRYTQSGSPVLSFTLAVNRSKRNADGSWTDEASFIDCVYFAPNSQNISQYLIKGKQVAVQGELRQNKWETDGQTRSKLEVVVNTLSLLSSGNQGQAAGGNFSSQYQQRPQQSMRAPEVQPSYVDSSVQNAMPGEGPESFEDDSIPF
ncbi:MAG: single-stranded DNA-binding protein [Spirochaetes bacterium]|uniref:Single-stranded DNA-binding protein n=1 Tax=Candidatus Ornithospirochaeta stercoripullorum TaxID=2840899 RepID=A0A9D9DY09_9SPIO|nr:single-stranded DNA-binding protein [Candidatus Ornithospirochaeta stercoripullorum]